MTELPSDTTLTAADLLQLIQWHIDRYDRLRSSTSSRAAVLMSANAALLGGTILLANSLIQATGVTQPATWAMRIFACLTIFMASISIAFCTNAVAAWRTTRSLHRKEIPIRFAFNWGDTLDSVDGFSNFAEKMSSQRIMNIKDSAVAELWTALLQHKRRHKYLRYGIHTFRASALLFVGVAAILLFFR